MITPLYGVSTTAGRARPTTERDRLKSQILFGKALTGPEAARKIARRIEEQGGFWGPRKVD